MNILGVHTGPELQLTESNLRFNLCTLPVQEKLTSENSIVSDYVKVMEHQIGQHIISDYPNDKWVDASIYLYEYPNTNQYINGDKRLVKELLRYNFCNFKKFNKKTFS